MSGLIALASVVALADGPNLWVEAQTQHLQKGKSITEATSSGGDIKIFACQ